MAEVQLILPQMGEGIVDATITKWLKQVGDTIIAEESILEIATDKVDSEVPSPVSGTLSKILYKEGDVVEVGKSMAVISGVSEEEAKKVSADVQIPPNIEEEVVQEEGEKVVEEVTADPPEEIIPQATAPITPAISGSDKRFYSPLVMSIARKENIDITELAIIPGKGRDGRVTKSDMVAYLKKRNGGAPSPEIRVEKDLPPKPAPSKPLARSGGDEILEMDRVRKLTAQHMIMSKQTSAHVTSVVEADVTEMVTWRERVKGSFEEREHEKLTFTPLFIEVIVKAIKDYPVINSTVDQERIIIKKDINIGMATALPGGNLIVPVIKKADEKNLVGLAKEVNSLAARARDSKLKPDEIEGGSFTFTNIGTFDNIIGTPIIFQPQVAILAVGAIKKRPVVISSPQGDMIAIRHMMYLSLSYDHRIIDGAIGGAFVKKIADYLEHFETTRNF